MAIEAPLSKYSRNSFLIYIGICLVLAAWFAYDGYLSKRFIEEHTNEQGLADTDLLINRYAPPFLAGAAVVLGLWLCAIRGRKLVADEDGLMISAKKRIPYSAIESIDKTHFEGKGFFTIAYEKGNGTQARCKVSDRQYDNLKAVLEHLVAKIAPEPVSLEQIEAAETGAMASIKQADQYIPGYSEIWARLNTRDRYLKEVLEAFGEPQRTQYVERLWELARQMLNSDDLTWDTMCLLFEQSGGMIVDWSASVSVPPDILDAAERALASWDKLRCGNPTYANYDANSPEHREAIGENVARLRKRQA